MGQTTRASKNKVVRAKSTKGGRRSKREHSGLRRMTDQKRERGTVERAPQGAGGGGKRYFLGGTGRPQKVDAESG